MFSRTTAENMPDLLERSCEEAVVGAERGQHGTEKKRGGGGRVATPKTDNHRHMIRKIVELLKRTSMRYFESRASTSSPAPFVLQLSRYTVKGDSGVPC
ncbi:hypothetical protein BaRGS_00019942 [Batillaria attramentaria]|uniref:Uncharacterized protein n=1 Tax=Batillaria attramentaria TaxID=370345 RepID=A0ABD0KNN8_9CAEN